MQKYLLTRKDGKPVCLHGKWLMAKEIYLSDICLAVYLKPRKGQKKGDWLPEKAKDELYTFLRWLRHLAMEEDLVRPVAGVASESDFRSFGANVVEAVKGWGADQEWHRGSFTFYLEPGNGTGRNGNNSSMVQERLADLLDPCPKDIEPNQPPENRDSKYFLEKILQQCRPQREENDTMSSLLDALEAWIGNSSDNDDIYSSELHRWKQKILDHVEKLEKRSS